MSWPFYFHSNGGTIPASALLGDIIVRCEAQLANPATPSVFRTFYVQIRANAQNCLVNSQHGSNQQHGPFVMPGPNGPEDDTVKLDKAFSNVAKCFEEVLKAPSFLSLGIALGEIEHNTGGTGGPKP